VHRPLEQTWLALQLMPPQQGWPAAPQGTQFLLLQVVPGAVHAPLQQPWPSPPQLPQLPFMQTPPTLHIAPTATQLPASQQPPPLQALFGQQFAPTKPQNWPAMSIAASRTTRSRGLARSAGPSP